MAVFVPSVERDPSKEWGADTPGLLKLLATVETHPEILEACMSRERNLRNAALVAGCAVLLASCGGTETTRSAASAAPAGAAATLSSGEDVTLESPQASAIDADESPASQAPEEQAQADGPALASQKATTICIENLSSVTPVVSFLQYQEQAGEGPLKFRARACATGYGTGAADVRGRIGLPAPNEPIKFYANNDLFGKPTGALNQEQDERVARCLSSVRYSVGDRRTWDDGVLLYAFEREPDGVGLVFRITIRDSAKPSADGKPAKCPL